MSSFDVIVVAGGASRRMGTDKALLTIDRTSLLDRAIDASIEAGASRVVVAGREQPIEGVRPSVEWLVDSEPGSGPLGAVLDAMAYLADRDGQVVVVVAVDHPVLHSAELRALATILSEQPASILGVVPTVRGREQPLHAAYRLSISSVLRASFAAGERSLVRALAALNIHRPDRSDDDGSYADVDEPSQWAAYVARNT
jgi:molybdenum cofactor guanylyltransferase